MLEAHALLPASVVLTPATASAVSRIDWATHTTPFGRCWLATSDAGICALGFPDEHAPPEHRSSHASLLRQLTVAFPHARITEDSATTGVWHRRLYSSVQPVPVVVNASAFALRVWNALLEIPCGAVTTYGALAERLGTPGATRAVGTAVGRNLVSWLVPCHRVVPVAGDVGQYRWGSERKRLMLAWETRAVPHPVLPNLVPVPYAEQRL